MSSRWPGRTPPAISGKLPGIPTELDRPAIQFAEVRDWTVRDGRYTLCLSALEGAAGFAGRT
jgi:hypothetical protein